MDTPEHDISDRLGQLLEQAVDLNLDRLRQQQPVLPWLLCATAAGQTITVFSDLEVSDAIATARQQVASHRPPIRAYVMGYQGQIATQDGPVAALFYEIGEQGQAVAFEYMVGYTHDDGQLVVDDNYNGVLAEKPNWTAPQSER